MLWRLIRTHLRPYAGFVAAILVLQLLATLASLYLPSLNGQIIDKGVVAGDTGYILRTGAVMLAVTVLNILATAGVAYAASFSSAAVARDLRGAVFERVGAFSAQELSRFGAPTLISRNTNDVTQVQTVLNMGLMFMVSIPIMMIGGIFMALREDVGLSWLVAVAVPLLGVIVGSIVVRMVPWFRKMQESVDTVNRVLREQITGIRVVRAFVREEHEERRFDDANTTYTGTALAVGRLFSMVFPLVMLVFNAASIAVIWFGAHRIASGQMTIGSMNAFMTYLVQILMSVMFGVMMSMMIPRASVSAGRITEVLDTRSSVVEASTPTPIRQRPAGVELREVTFTYPGADAPVLRAVTASVRPGQTTAIVGSTGAGKSTLVSLIARLYDVTDGAILVEALRVAQADDFVRQMPGGLDAPISQGGSNVSGGQRQRLAIARALVRRPDIYLFDDSCSALDLATDARLRAALAPHTKEAAVVVVAQRISTILEADQIIVLEDGRVVGSGRHTDLVATCPTYAEIVASQAVLEDAA